MENTPTASAAGAADEDPVVTAALARLEGLEDRAVTEHPQIFADVDDRLRAALASPAEGSEATGSGQGGA